MASSKRLILFVVAAFAMGAGCTRKDEDQAQEVRQEVKDKAKEIANEVVDKSKQVLSATGEAISDGWITTKIKAKFADEKLLKDDDITVETKERVVTLKGTVSSGDARSRAVSIAGGTDGVGRVVDELKVKSE